MEKNKILYFFYYFLSFSFTLTAFGVTDDFNRIDTTYSTDGSTIGANWVSADSSDKFSISGNELLMDTVTAPGILYNNAQQTLSGSGSNFTLSADVAGRVSNCWQGIVFNYQNASNYYTLRFKTDTTGYQLLGFTNGGVAVVASGNASAAFTAGTLYTLMVVSDTACRFYFTIQAAGSSVVLNPVRCRGYRDWRPVCRRICRTVFRVSAVRCAGCQI